MKKEQFVQTELGKILENARYAKKDNINDVARATGISRQYIRALELGEKKVVGFDIIVRLAFHYDLDLNELGKHAERGNYKRVPKSKKEE